MLDASALDSWQLLVDRLAAFVGRRLPAQEVDDVVQDVLLRIHRNAQHLQDDTRFGSWVYTIARNAVTDHLRSRKAVSVELSEEPVGTATDANDPPPLVDCVAGFVARLPSPYRQAVTLVDLQQMTQADAAEVEGVTLSGMKSRVQRGRRQIRRMFEECCDLKIDARGRVFDTKRRNRGDDPCSCDPKSVNGA